MNGINRIGQKVVCINDDFSWSEGALKELFSIGGLNQLPKINEIYTVSGFKEVGEPEIYIYLEECIMKYGEITFSVDRFRPLQTRNKHVTAMIKKYSTEKIDA